MDVFRVENGALLFRRRQERMEIRGWGKGLRIRATENRAFSERDWALSIPVETEARVTITERGAVVENGGVRAEITPYGKITFFNAKGEQILKEYYRSWDYGTENWEDLDQITMVRAAARTYRSVGGDNYAISLRFEADDRERLYGMGQYQNGCLDLKGCTLEMEQKNTQACVPFLVSSLGYGLLWNNPSVGRASLGRNLTEFEARSAKQLDYWITAGEEPAEIVEAYSEVTGRVPMMPDYAMGFWQCRLRYCTQEEVLQVAREYHRRGIPVKVMVVDFFHWPHQGDWAFDHAYWPDPAGMVRELAEMGMKLMVSVWPTVDRDSVHYQEMRERDLLIRVNRGLPAAMECWGMESFLDATNPEAREFVWNTCKENYRRQGVELFWLDEAEPEYSAADFDLYRYYDGDGLECANEYPVRYAQAFYEGMKADGVDNPINLIRCAWAGSQKYGALVWSGDVPSTFRQLRQQFTAGLNMGLAGIPWWTADIGGFHGGNIHDPAFHELLVRWFQFGTFCPVMRLHGDRDPHDKAPVGTSGGGMVASGADNELWSYPEPVSAVMESYIRLRERLQPYIRETMREAHEKGTPVIKPLFYDFPQDGEAWRTEDAFLFGHGLLAAPVFEAGVRERTVYLPRGTRWTEAATGKIHNGGTGVLVDAPLERIPLFVREGWESLLPLLFPTIS